MPEPQTTPKIEELRARLRADPRSRIFYPLAEELRKIGRFDESKEVLLNGLASHPTYLSAWVSLGRVLKEMDNNRGAVDAFNKALTLDPENVVAARLLADSYLALGENVEAIKKFKLVHALMPGDQDIEARIESLERSLNPPRVMPLSEMEAEAPAQIEKTAPFDLSDLPLEPLESLQEEQAEAEIHTEGEEYQITRTLPAIPLPEPVAAEMPPEETQELPSAATRDQAAEAPSDASLRLQEPQEPVPVEPAAPAPPVQAVEEEESVWIDDEPEEKTPETPPDAGTLETDSSPALAPFDEEPAPASSSLSPEEMEAHPFAASSEEMPADEAAPREVAEEEDEVLATMTMADLYAQQGHYASARRIYEKVLEKHPDNDSAKLKLRALPGGEPAVDPAAHRRERVRKLEAWLSKVRRREESGV